MHVKGLKDDIKGVLFDLDGLLVNSEDLYWQANIQASKEEHLDTPHDTYLKLMGAPVEVMENFYHRYFRTKAERDRFIKRTNDLVWQWTDAGKLKLRPGVQIALDRFQALGLRMALVSSNYEKVVQHSLWATGIRNYFSFHMSNIDVQKEGIKAKPAPDIYLSASRKIKLPKNNLIVFEDSAAGVKAAYNAGLKVVMIPDLLAPTKADQERATMICPSFGNFLKKV